SDNGKYFYLYFDILTRGNAKRRGRSYVFAVRPGAELPTIPPGGIKSEGDLAKLGATVQPASKADDVAPGPSPAIYAFNQRTIQRNLYRVPLPSCITLASRDLGKPLSFLGAGDEESAS